MFRPRLPRWLRPIPTCLLCAARSDQHDRALCHACELDLPWLGAQCSCCALPLPLAGQLCGACLKRPPAFEQVLAPWRYAFPLDSLISRFKHQGQWPLGHLLAGRLAAHLTEAFANGLPRPAALLPVPLAGPRLRRRGFNQAAMLARWLGHDLGLAVDEHSLLRQRDTPAQQGLDAATRRRNLRQAFVLAATAAIAGRHLALVDDVLTTGATAEELARLLRRAGASRVDIYCLARTASPGD